MVVGVLGAFAGLAKVNYARTVVDSPIFRLHYRWTTTLCLLSGILVMASDVVGNAIECIYGEEDAKKAVTTYCWISSTFTINTTGPMAGIGPYHPKVHEKTIHTYYQWVPVVLFLQAVLFYLPHLIWKLMEGKQLDLMLQDLNKAIFSDDTEKKIKNLVTYLAESSGFNMSYFLGYYLCECLNLVNVVSQMFLMERFFNGAFLDYGSKVLGLLNSNYESRSDVFTEVFPRIAKCTFPKYGPSGTIVHDDVLCVLPQNIINEKIFLVMWLWFITLAVLTSLQLLFHLAVYSSTVLRSWIISHRAKMTKSIRLEQHIRNSQLGDFCLLDSIGRNLEVVKFREVVKSVLKAAEEPYGPSAPNYATYKPFSTREEAETLPRKRHTLYTDPYTVEH